MKKLFLIIFLSFISLIFVSCSNLEILNEKYDLDKLDKILTDINNLDLDLQNTSIGYDSDGNIVLWVEQESLISDDYDKYDIPNPLYGYYSAYMAKRTLDIISDVDSILVHYNNRSSDKLVYLTRDTYNQNLKNFPDDKKEFFETDKKIEELVDMYYEVEANDVLETNTKPIERNFNTIFGDRLEILEFSGTDFVGNSINVKGIINEIPKDESQLTIEIAKAFVQSVGRFENQYWNFVSGTNLTYKENDSELFRIIMYDDTFNEWYENGLKLSDLYKYSRIDIYDKKVEYLFTNEGNIQEVTQSNYDVEELNYEETMEKVKNIEGVEIELLTNNEDDIKVVIKIEDNETSFKKQMDITNSLMKTPIDSIWFISENETTLKLSYIDRERYNLLFYMNDTSEYDFQPNEWPIMVERYIEIEK